MPAPTFRLIVLLTLLVTVGPLSTDMYLPSLPGIAADLGASEATVQLTIGVFIGGFALMMLIIGPLADRFGRRPVIGAGLTLFVAASIGCALAPDIEVLLAGRLVQAMGASVGPVLGRAIIRDLYPPREAGRVLGLVSSVMAFAPIIAPFIGGVLETSLGWRANFWLLTGFGLAVLVWLWRDLPETLRQPLAGGLAPLSLLTGYASLLGSRAYLGFMLAVALTFGALFSWISNASFIVIGHFGLAPERFGVAFALVILGYVFGALAGSRLGPRLGAAGATGIGVALCALAGLGLAVATLTDQGGLAAIVALTHLTFFGVGIVLPQATAGALGPFPDRAASAAALLGFVQMTAGLTVNALSAAAFDGTPVPFGLINAGSALLALAAWALLVRPDFGSD
jgi:DHA1 family bicyclomycin/chloramphenicol resistance-like MFS transporter